MHNDNLSYAETFDKALEGLFEEGKAKDMDVPTGEGRHKKVPIDSLINRADEAFEKYLKDLGEKRFDEAAGALKALEKALGQLTAQAGTEEPGSD
jgi:hypothetical protein